MAQEIVQIQQMGDALRNTGYKNIGSAISEIIDNSVEAEAKDIFIVVSEMLDNTSGRKFVNEIAVIDNGNGMDEIQLGSCLGIGFTTRRERRGMGRFGVGLPQSSLHVCPAVDVYSWQERYSNCKKVYLDINKVKTGEQTNIEDPVLSAIPAKYSKYLSYRTENKNYDFNTNGTLVHWKNCDRVSPKTINFLFRDLQKAIGEKFRYKIQSGDCNIRLINIDNDEHYVDILPNDPLFLMKPNYVLGNSSKPGQIDAGHNEGYTEALFEPYTGIGCDDGVVTLPIEYFDIKLGRKNVSNVIIKFSKIRNVFYDKTAIAGDPGSTPMGKHAKEMEGISIVRAGREIDFGQFDFYENLNQPQHRWWGCEISFEPELDEAFGVANNKQYVELKKVDERDYADEEIKPVWLQLYSIVHGTISAMYSANKETRESARTLVDVVSPSSEIINTVEKDNDVPTATDDVKKTEAKETLIEKAKKTLKEQGIESPTDEEAIRYIDNKVNIIYANLGRGPFFDYSFKLGSAIVKINTEHDFYKKAYINVLSNNETKVAFELFIASLVRTIDELESSQSDANDLLVQEWNNKLRKYINAQNGKA